MHVYPLLAPRRPRHLQQLSLKHHVRYMPYHTQIWWLLVLPYLRPGSNFCFESLRLVAACKLARKVDARLLPYERTSQPAGNKASLHLDLTVLLRPAWRRYEFLRRAMTIHCHR